MVPGASRMYSQLMSQYRTFPETLHRDPVSVGIVARNRAILLWSDFSHALAPLPTDSEEIAAVKSEILHRIN
jgi:hypothetical protein